MSLGRRPKLKNRVTMMPTTATPPMPASVFIHHG